MADSKEHYQWDLWGERVNSLWTEWFAGAILGRTKEWTSSPNALKKCFYEYKFNDRRQKETVNVEFENYCNNL